MSKQKITDYKIINDNSITDLVDYIQSLIKNGWQPLGGVAHDSKDDYYIQTMVKYEHCEVEDE